MNTFTMCLTCPKCFKEIKIIEQTSNIRPSKEGKCPKCATLIGWEAEDMVLTSFKPHEAREMLTSEVTIDFTWKD
jgi:endogenous inhibitor of DNA gyrase (YacG/DUF329 family)